MRGASRGGTALGMFTMLVLITGCDPCLNNPCDDGLACNGTETCTGDGGQAVCADGTPVVCDAGTACTEPDGACVDPCIDADCDDGDPCTTDTCAPSEDGTAACMNEDEGCDDGDVCTENDACDSLDGICSGTPIECPEGEVCDGGVCVPSCTSDAECDDDDLCTDDMCDASGRCSHTARVCAEGESCDPATGECGSETLVQVDVLQLGNFYYPTALFRCAAAEDEREPDEFCPNGAGCDEFHWHSDAVAAILSVTGVAGASENTVTDPLPCRCGHGKVSEVSRSTIEIGESEMEAYLGTTTLDALPSAGACP